jgi:hypothetical protein
VVDLIDGGTGTNPKMKLLSNAQPTSPDDSEGTGNTIVTIDLGAAAVFGNAGTSGNSATATASGILTKTGTAGTTGTAVWFRVYDKSGDAVIDGSCGTATADLILDNTTINSGQEVKLKTWKVKLPKVSS